MELTVRGDVPEVCGSGVRTERSLGRNKLPPPTAPQHPFRNSSDCWLRASFSSFNSVQFLVHVSWLQMTCTVDPTLYYHGIGAQVHQVHSHHPHAVLPMICVMPAESSILMTRQLQLPACPLNNDT